MTFRQPLTYNRPLGQANQAPPGFIQGRVGGPSGGIQFAGNGQWKAYDWPNPTLRKDAAYLLAAARSESDVWSNRLLDLLKAKDKQFAGAGQWKSYDYPNPVGWDVRSGAQPSVDLKTWIHGLDRLLLGKDRQFRGPGQWTTYDWPNPNLGRVRDVTLLTWTQSPRPVAVTQAPFSQDDWPNPTIVARSLDLLAWVQGPVPPATVIQNPFAQGDWPNPSARQRDIGLLTWTQGPKPVSLQAPFTQVDWPNPKGPITLSWTFIVQGPIPNAPIAAAPFSQGEWPNPRGFVSPVWTFLDPVRVNLIGKDKAFGTTLANYDWPIPPGPVYPLELRTFLQNLQQNTLAPFVLSPFNFTGWSNPPGALFSTELVNISSGFKMLDAIPPAVIVVTPTPAVGGGASGKKKYRQPAWWGDEKRRKLEKKVEAVQKQIEKKREQVDIAPDLYRMQRLLEQIQELQIRLMKLLEQIDELNKEFEMEEVLRIYLIYRSLH